MGFLSWYFLRNLHVFLNHKSQDKPVIKSGKSEKITYFCKDEHSTETVPGSKESIDVKQKARAENSDIWNQV